MKKHNLLITVCICFLSVLIFTQFGFIYANAADKCTTCTPVPVKGYSPTCSEKGLSDGFKCSVCGDILVAQTEIPATGEHTPVVVKGHSATCGDKGLSDGFKCSVCGETIVAQTEIPATGEHTSVPVKGYSATCLENGKSDGFKCSVCDEILVPQVDIPATGHSEVIINAIAGDCQHPGYTEGKKCETCGEILLAQVSTGPGNHVMDDGKCTVCGYEISSASDADLDDVPQTGDVSNIYIFVVIAMISMFASFALVFNRIHSF